MEPGWYSSVNTVGSSTLGMILLIKFSGGMGVSYQGSVDLSTLPGDLLEEVRAELTEKKISQSSRGEKDQFINDSVSYEFQYENSHRAFTLDESQASEEQLELIDKLRPYLKLEPK